LVPATIRIPFCRWASKFPSTSITPEEESLTDTERLSSSIVWSASTTVRFILPNPPYVAPLSRMGPMCNDLLCAMENRHPNSFGTVSFSSPPPNFLWRLSFLALDRDSLNFHEIPSPGFPLDAGPLTKGYLMVRWRLRSIIVLSLSSRVSPRSASFWNRWNLDVDRSA